MIKKTITIGFLAAGVAMFASARIRTRASEPAYRIELRGNTAVLSRDQPVTRGSVVLFHRSADGVYTSVPAEDVAAIRVIASTARVAGRRIRSTGAARVATDANGNARPLAPGDAVLIGNTAGDAPGSGAAPLAPPPGTPVSPSSGIAARQALDSQVFPGDLPGTGAAGTGTANAGSVVNPSLTTNGTTTGATTTGRTPPTGIGSNGFPVTSTTGPQSGTQPVGSNGYPTLSTPPATTAPAGGTANTTPTGNGATNGSGAANPTVPATGSVTTTAPAKSGGSSGH